MFGGASWKVTAPLGDPVAGVALDLGQVPRHLAERAALGIGAEVVLIGWERLQKPHRELAFHVPDLAKPLDLIRHCHRSLVIDVVALLTPRSGACHTALCTIHNVAADPFAMRAKGERVTDPASARFSSVLDASGTPISANDGILYRLDPSGGPAAEWDGAAVIHQDSVGGRFETDGSFGGTRWHSQAMVSSMTSRPRTPASSRTGPPTTWRGPARWRHRPWAGQRCSACARMARVP